MRGGIQTDIFITIFRTALGNEIKRFKRAVFYSLKRVVMVILSQCRYSYS